MLRKWGERIWFAYCKSSPNSWMIHVDTDGGFQSMGIPPKSFFLAQNRFKTIINLPLLGTPPTFWKPRNKQICGSNCPAPFEGPPNIWRTWGPSLRLLGNSDRRLLGIPVRLVFFLGGWDWLKYSLCHMCNIHVYIIYDYYIYIYDYYIYIHIHIHTIFIPQFTCMMWIWLLCKSLDHQASYCI